MPRPVLVLLAVVVLMPLAFGSASEPFAPSRVMVESDGSVLAVVQWIPGAEPADSYRVYGLDGEGFALLVDTKDAAAPLMLAVAVPAGYSAYAVSGVRENVESRLVFAGDIPVGCIRIMTDPPAVGVDGCSYHVSVKVHNPL